MELVLIEPLPASVRRLRRTAELNDFKVRVVQAAVGSREGRLTLRGNAWSMANFYSEAYEPRAKDAPTTLAVPVVRLDSVVAEPFDIIQFSAATLTPGERLEVFIDDILQGARLTVSRRKHLHVVMPACVAPIVNHNGTNMTWTYSALQERCLS